MEPITAALFIAGQSASSRAAVALVHDLCERLAPGAYRLEVVDVYQDPELARGEGVTVTPTLIRRRPEPSRRAVGALDAETIVRVLGLEEQA